MGREARLMCWALVVFMRNQSRQQVKFQTLLAERAHFMRHNATETEQILWCQFAGRALGVAFKRQVLLDRYIVEFLAPSVGLVVEVDGAFIRLVAHGTRVGTAHFGGSGTACCGLMRNWSGATSRKLSLKLWLRFAQLDYCPVQLGV